MDFRDGGTGVVEKQISSMEPLGVTGLKLWRPTKHVSWKIHTFMF